MRWISSTDNDTIGKVKIMDAIVKKWPASAVKKVKIYLFIFLNIQLNLTYST